MVVWEDGKMRKSDYRKFIVRTVEGSDDFASIREVVDGLALEWGAVAGDLTRADGARIRVSRRLRDSAIAWLAETPPGAGRAERAVQFALEVARLLGPTVRLVAQMRLEARSEEEQRRALLESEGEVPLSDAVGRLLALIASGTA